MSSVLEIANQALLEIGESAVTQTEYDDRSTKAAKIVGQRYESCKAQVLRSYFWRRAEKRIKIEADSITETAADLKYGITIGGVDSFEGEEVNLYLKTAGSPNTYYESSVFKYTRNFTVPGDISRLKLVVDENGRLVDHDYVSGVVLADVDTLYIAYTQDIDEDDMDASLADTISAFLAYKIARFLGVSDEVPALLEAYFTQWRFAKSYDAQQDSARTLTATDWLEDRLGGNSVGAPYIQLQ